MNVYSNLLTEVSLAASERLGAFPGCSPTQP
jgi:hypothetical protein